MVAHFLFHCEYLMYFQVSHSLIVDFIFLKNILFLFIVKNNLNATFKT